MPLRWRSRPTIGPTMSLLIGSKAPMLAVRSVSSIRVRVPRRATALAGGHQRQPDHDLVLPGLAVTAGRWRRFDRSPSAVRTASSVVGWWNCRTMAVPPVKSMPSGTTAAHEHGGDAGPDQAERDDQGVPAPLDEVVIGIGENPHARQAPSGTPPSDAQRRGAGGPAREDELEQRARHEDRREHVRQSSRRTASSQSRGSARCRTGTGTPRR